MENARGGGEEQPRGQGAANEKHACAKWVWGGEGGGDRLPGEAALEAPRAADDENSLL